MIVGRQCRSHELANIVVVVVVVVIVIFCSARTDGLSLWLVRRCGILCQTSCAILVLAETNSDNIWERLCSLRTSAYSALEVLRLCAV